MKKNTNIFNFICLAGFLLLVWSAFAPEAKAQQAVVPTQSAPKDILVSGKLACSLKRTVIVPFFGVISALSVQSGQKVASGQLLASYRLLPESVAKIRSRLFPTDIKELEISLVKLTAKLGELTKKRAGLQQLAQENLTSRQSLEQVEQEIRLNCQEKATVTERLGWARQLHQDDLAVLRKQLGNPAAIKNISREGKLLAPLDGYVVWVHPDLRVGAEVKPEQPAFVIGDIDTMIIKAQVHELEAMRLHLGDQAEVQVASLPGNKFSARVSRVSWSSTTSATDQPSFFEVEFSLSNPDHILKDGLKVQIILPKASSS